jgi:uncharacterized protein
MNRSALLVLSALIVLPAFGQVKKTETVNAATNPADDRKGLSPNVPDSTSVSAKIERVVLIRLRNQTDILAGIEKEVKAQGIKNAVILTGFGSAIATHYHVVSNRGFPSKNLFVENPTASADIVNFSGAVMSGRIHAHITFADPDKAYGGHLEPRTHVFTFAFITLGVLADNPDLSRFDDKNWR